MNAGFPTTESASGKVPFTSGSLSPEGKRIANSTAELYTQCKGKQSSPVFHGKAPADTVRRNEAHFVSCSRPQILDRSY